MNFRYQQKLNAIRKRGGFSFNDYIKCDLCGINWGTQYHERIKRSQTMGNEEARQLSFQEELCNLLCPECHQIADTKEVDHKLWNFSIDLYGKQRVIQALSKLNSSRRAKIIIEWLNDETTT